MVFTSKTVGFALLSLGFAARQAAAVSDCGAINTAISAGGTVTITLEADIVCVEHIPISTSQTVEITSDGTTGPHTLTIGTQFAGGVASEADGGTSLIFNEGDLTINGVNFAMAEDAEGYRTIFNSGTLSVVNCEFDLFHNGAYIDEGGAVSGVSVSLASMRTIVPKKSMRDV